MTNETQEQVEPKKGMSTLTKWVIAIVLLALIQQCSEFKKKQESTAQPSAKTPAQTTQTAAPQPSATRPVTYAAEDQLSKTVNAAHRVANLMDNIGGSDPVCHMLADQIRVRANQMSSYDGAGPEGRAQAAQQLAVTVKQFMTEGNERGCLGHSQ